MKSNLPDKSQKYVLNNSTGNIWEIWESEDFSDGYVLLYEAGTSNDYTILVEKFDQYFTAI